MQQLATENREAHTPTARALRAHSFPSETKSKKKFRVMQQHFGAHRPICKELHLCLLVFYTTNLGVKTQRHSPEQRYVQQSHFY